MSTSIFKWTRWTMAMVIIVLLTISASTADIPPAAAQAVPGDGIVCTTDSSPNPTFTLTTKTGYIGTPDDNVVFMWGFSAGTNGFQHPSPVLCVHQGDTVTVIVHNTLNEDVSIIFPGQQDVLANGVPVQPQFDGGGALTSLAQVAPANGGNVTYRFVATEPGTYLYQSGANPAKQVRMGLFGALIVRPSRGDNFAFQTGDNQFKQETEFMVLLSEIDPLLNQAVERGRPFNMNNYTPRYFMLNGRGFPDSIASNFASWLPTQPYGALVHIHPFNDTPLDPGYNPDPALVRYLNVTSQNMPFHPHGQNGLVVGRDGRPLEGPGGQDMAFEKFTLNIGPGQTWDVMTRWYDAEQYESAAHEVPVTVPSLQNMVYGTFFGGSPYLGEQGLIPVGTTTLNQCGEYYIISHNHSLFQITSWGIPMTGPITYLRIDPPLPNSCP